MQLTWDKKYSVGIKKFDSQHKRVIIIGSGGAGKSTLARQLGRITDLPVIHLDTHYWRPGWMETPKDEWKRVVERLLAGERWIIDGNYGGTFDIRLAAADTVIYLDFPPAICLYRVIKRRIANRNKTRSDMGPGCPEKIDTEKRLSARLDRSRILTVHPD